jgi:hypothetical protein
MNKLIALWKIVLPFLILMESVARNLDTNDTGADDQIADKIKEATIFIAGIIAANGDTSAATVARGYDAILAFGNNVLTSLTQLETAEMSKPEKISKAAELVAMLSDPSKVYQAQKGKDAAALAVFKEKAGEKLTAIENS